MIDSWVPVTDFPHERGRRGAARGAMDQFHLIEPQQDDKQSA